MSTINEFKDKGVIYRGRVGHEELALEFLSSGYWLYPCVFDEISCITAMKAQASGCWPITNKRAALAETCKFGTFMDDSKENWVDDIPKSLTKARKIVNIKKRDEMKKKSLKMFSWESLAKDWNSRIREWISTKK